MEIYFGNSLAAGIFRNKINRSEFLWLFTNHLLRHPYFSIFVVLFFMFFIYNSFLGEIVRHLMRKKMVQQGSANYCFACYLYRCLHENFTLFYVNFSNKYKSIPASLYRTPLTDKVFHTHTFAMHVRLELIMPVDLSPTWSIDFLAILCLLYIYLSVIRTLSLLHSVYNTQTWLPHSFSVLPLTHHYNGL